LLEPTYRIAQINGMEVEFLDLGAGPLVVCLHGFPDQPYTWAPLLRTLATQGFRGIAPCLRGYTPASKAADGNYREWALASDVLELISTLGYERATIIGHDWGAAAAYVTAAIAPERVGSIVTLAVPHGPTLGRAMIFDSDQQRRSWYWYFLQLPWAEAAVAHNDFAFIDRLWRDWSPGFEIPAPHMRMLRERMAAPGVLPEILAYYRQAFDVNRRPSPELTARLARPITVPTLYLHGRSDGCIGADLGEGTAQLFSGPYHRRIVEGVGHFLHVESPERIGSEILTFLQALAREFRI
jgi:pimeloyl-ACP methyl ester carboxylesterase